MLLRTPSLLAVLCVALVGLAGCVSEAPPKPPASTTTAPPPIVTAIAGSVTGVVIDEELLPVPGVQVAVLETRNVTTTDAAGVYTLNGLDAGTYSIHFSRAGYVENGKRVDVLAGVVTHLNVTVKPLVIIEGYQFTIPRSSFIKFGQWTVNHVQQSLNQSALNEQICSDCWHVLVLPSKIRASQTETIWNPSVNTAATNQQLGIGVSKSWGDGQLSTYFIIKNFVNREKFVWPDAALTEVKDGGKIRINLQGPSPTGGIVFQQKFDVYSTFAVNQDIDGNFTALPPA